MPEALHPLCQRVARSLTPRACRPGREPFMSEQTQAKVTVLVVDDDVALRRGLYWALNEEKYRVLEAGTRAEACELLKREKIDVVLSDLRLPPTPNDISEGLAVVEAARSLRPPVPVI